MASVANCVRSKIFSHFTINQKLCFFVCKNCYLKFTWQTSNKEICTRMTQMSTQTASHKPVNKCHCASLRLSNCTSTCTITMRKFSISQLSLFNDHFARVMPFTLMPLKGLQLLNGKSKYLTIMHCTFLKNL